MPFTLKVEFAGLCLYLLHKNGEEVAVLQPDCRPDGTREKMAHLDGTPAVPHVGYMRIDLANITAGLCGSPEIPAGNSVDGPRYEVIYRFDCEDLDLGLPRTREQLNSSKLDLPRFEEFAWEPDSMTGEPVPLLVRRPGLFSKAPGDELLMRTFLHGGEFMADGHEPWKFSRLFCRQRKTAYQADFDGVIPWVRHVEDADGLTLRIQRFDGTTAPVEIPLKPATPGGEIHLKVANLCSENPLEWDSLDLHVVNDDDQDFKWLYRLLQPTNGRTYKDLLLDSVLPTPQRPPRIPAGRQDCFGGVLNVADFAESRREKH